MSRAMKNAIASTTKLEAKNFLRSGVAAVSAVASDLFRVGAVAIFVVFGGLVGACGWVGVWFRGRLDLEL
jgi:hypothetical protein